MLPGIFALLTAIAGWYYLLHAGSVAGLGSIERQSLNRMRIRLRRCGGLCMFLLAGCTFTLVKMVEQESFLIATWLILASGLLLAAILVLALVDLRLTSRIRQDHS